MMKTSFAYIKLKIRKVDFSRLSSRRYSISQCNFMSCQITQKPTLFEKLLNNVLQKRVF